MTPNGIRLFFLTPVSDAAMTSLCNVFLAHLSEPLGATQSHLLSFTADHHQALLSAGSCGMDAQPVDLAFGSMSAKSSLTTCKLSAQFLPTSPHHLSPETQHLDWLFEDDVTTSWYYKSIWSSTPNI